MKNSILLILLAFISFSGFSATVTVSNSGLTFTPAAITINLGDEVNFTISSSHDVVEVSKTTWDAKGNTPISGGFSLPLGGGLLTADKLTAGIHYYVCSPHAELGMIGVITVVNTTAIAENKLKEGISIFPNPSNGNFQLKLDQSLSAENYDLGIYTVKGEKIFSISDTQLKNSTKFEVLDLPKGVYIVRLYGRMENHIKKIVVQ